MLACAADEILMGEQSSLGPIDPQFIVHNRYGSYMQPARFSRKLGCWANYGVLTNQIPLQAVHASRQGIK